MENVITETRVCTTCNEEKELKYFIARKSVLANGEHKIYYQSFCKRCERSKYKTSLMSDPIRYQEYLHKKRESAKRSLLKLKENNPERYEQRKEGRRNSVKRNPDYYNSSKRKSDSKLVAHPFIPDKLIRADSRRRLLKLMQGEENKPVIEQQIIYRATEIIKPELSGWQLIKQAIKGINNQTEIKEVKKSINKRSVAYKERVKRKNAARWEKTKNDPELYAKYRARQARREKRRWETIRNDPEKMEAYRIKNREKQARLQERLNSDPELKARYLQKVRERAKKNALKKNANSTTHAAVKKSAKKEIKPFRKKRMSLNDEFEFLLKYGRLD